jgi:hypothetical protein
MFKIKKMILLCGHRKIVPPAVGKPTFLCRFIGVEGRARRARLMMMTAR